MKLLVLGYLVAAVIFCATECLLAAPANAASASAPFTLTVNSAVGFYVATTGSDSNSGTAASPFATVDRCSSAMRGSSTKLCYVEPGTYAQKISLTSADNGEIIQEDPAQGTNTAIFTGMNMPATAGFLVNSGTATVSLVGTCGTHGTVVTVNPSGDNTGVSDTNAINAAISGLSSGGTVKLGAGSFFINRTNAAEIDIGSNIWLVGSGSPGAPGAPTSVINFAIGPQGTNFFGVNGNNIVVCGIKFNGTGQARQNFNCGGSGQPCGSNLFNFGATPGPISFIRNIFVNCDTCLHSTEPLGITQWYIQGNDFNGGSGSAFLIDEAVSIQTDNGAGVFSNISNLYETDNTFESIYRYAIENIGALGTVSHYHIDRNVVTNWADQNLGGSGAIAMSLVTGPAASGCHDFTIIGNTFQNNWGSGPLYAIEDGGAACSNGPLTLSNNTFTNVCSVSNGDIHNDTQAWLNNTIVLNYDGPSAGIGCGHPWYWFGAQGDTRYYGTNTITRVGGTAQQVNGCASPMYCFNAADGTGTGVTIIGTQPTLYPASQRFF